MINCSLRYAWVTQCFDNWVSLLLTIQLRMWWLHFWNHNYARIHFLLAGQSSYLMFINKTGINQVVLQSCDDCYSDFISMPDVPFGNYKHSEAYVRDVNKCLFENCHHWVICTNLSLANVLFTYRYPAMDSSRLVKQSMLFNHPYSPRRSPKSITVTSLLLTGPT